MLENVNLKRTLEKAEYKKAQPALQRRLYDLEKACWDENIPSMFVFEGWDAAGKGGTITAVTQRLDPRGFKLHATQEPRSHELLFPWLYRFWLNVPNRGEMVLFDHSWYHRVLNERVEKSIPPAQVQKAYTDIVEFERMLAADGAVIVKFWFHISKEEQKRRFRRIEKDPLEKWRVGEKDWSRHAQYEEYLESAERMLELTESAFAPWTIVEATSKWWARRKVFETMIAALERALGAKAPGVREEPAAKPKPVKTRAKAAPAAGKGRKR